jgi:hypothetical protein
MRYFVATLSGFLLTLVVFAGGGLTAIFFFVNAKPVPVAHPLDGDTGTLWTNKAVNVSADTQGLQRLPARPAPQTINPVPQKVAEVKQSPDDSAPSEPADKPARATDPTTTAATSPTAASKPEPRAASKSEPQAAPPMNAAHVEWCSQHYRSYDPADNSYNSYSGVRRECVSPYSDGASNADSPARTDETERVDHSIDRSPALVSAAADEMPGGYLSPEHVQSCFDRYRSYRPEDTSYQPYGGGPRQRCE